MASQICGLKMAAMKRVANERIDVSFEGLGLMTGNSIAYLLINAIDVTVNCYPFRAHFIVPFRTL